MALPYPIAPSQTDAKSPVDDNLMDSIRLDLEYLDSLFATGAAIFTWNINARLTAVRNVKKAIDTIPLFGEFQPGFVRANIKKSGTSGSLKFDIRRHTTPKTPITGIDHQYEGATTAISNVAPALATQSISRAASQILTQSISVAKATINVESIIFIGENKWRYNLASSPDADWAVGKYAILSGCTNAANNGTFEIVERNNSGYPSIVVRNSAGVAQTSPAGTIQLQLFSYNFANPVDSQFAADEIATFASHTTGANNGSFTIYKTNQGGNNIWVYNSTGAAQAGVAGTVDTNRWTYGLLSAASTTDFVVGEKAKMASHSNAANNGNFTIKGINVTTNNIIVYNPSGVVQGGVAGNINTNRWTYSLPTDPTSQISVGYNLQLEGHTTSTNNGQFDVRQVNRGASNNVVIYNENGATQAGSAGFVRTTRKIVKFSSNQASVYTATTSYVEMIGCPDSQYNLNDYKLPFQVLEVNRGGGSNYNIVIEKYGGTSQASPAGYIQTEMKSIFTSTPTIDVDTTSLVPNQFLKQTFTNIVAGLIPAETPLGLYILEIQGGVPEDLTLTMH